MLGDDVRNGTELVPNVFINSVFFVIAVSSSFDMFVGEVIPPVPACNESSCCVIVMRGFDAPKIAAPWGLLFAFRNATGTHTNFTLLCKAKEDCHKLAQCGHCGSNKI